MMEKNSRQRKTFGKNDQWVRPFLKRYKKTLYFALLFRLLDVL